MSSRLSNLSRVPTITLDLQKLVYTSEYSDKQIVEGYEYHNTYILDWDNYREGRLIGKVKLNCKGYPQGKILQVLIKTIDAIKTNGTFPSEVNFVDCDAPVINKWHTQFPLKSLNLRSIDSDGKIYDEPFIFIIGSKEDL